MIGDYDDIVHNKLNPPQNLSIVLFVYPREENQLEPQLYWQQISQPLGVRYMKKKTLFRRRSKTLV